MAMNALPTKGFTPQDWLCLNDDGKSSNPQINPKVFTAF